jgi:DNA helicase II / ATP-dependent DNA helicase PcrA
MSYDNGNGGFSTNVRNILVLAFNRNIADELNVRLRNPRALPPRTQYQTAICNAVMERQSNIVVNALAGSGKTTTIEHSVSDFQGANIRAQTCHGFGLAAHRYHLKQHNAGEPNVIEDKVSIILRQLTNAEALTPDDRAKVELKIGPAKRLVSLFKSQGFLAIRAEATDEECQALCDRYEIELPDPADTGITESDVFTLARNALIANNRDIVTIDYDDMIYLPVLMREKFFQQDLIYVDESQDLNPIRIALIKAASNNKAQCIFVGDRFQSIYGFTGADVEAIDTIVEQFNAVELPLSTCWRCPVEVIKEAQKIVPEIEHAPNAIQGSVGTVRNEDEMYAMAEPGDFVLCRTTAPLVECCMNFIRQGKAATVRGRDIGQGLENLADKIKRRRASKGKSLIEALLAYREDQMVKLAHPSKEAKLQSALDKVDTLAVLSEECESFEELKKKIKSIFSDDKNGETKDLILCSTAHKAKGLEAERVFIIKPELMPLPWAKQSWQKQQEMNLKYVAVTRASRDLLFVPSKERKRDEPEQAESQPWHDVPDQVQKPKRTRKTRVAKA